MTHSDIGKYWGLITVFEVEVEIVYNDTRISRLASLGPTCLFLSGLTQLGLDREPLVPTSPLAVTIPSKTYT
jgi:hypothetical protein